MRFGPPGSVNDAAIWLQATVFRIVQEALTNSLKHADGATRSAVTVDVDSQRVWLEVRDDGLGRGDGPPLGEPVAEEPGNGIRGMSERATMYGGSLTAGCDGDGWVVTAVLARAAKAPA